jgi:hypothetical protein
MSTDFAAVTKRLVRDDRASNRARRLERRQAKADRQAELLEARGMFAIALQALGVAFATAGNPYTGTDKPLLIVSRRLSLFSVAGYTVDYGSMREERLHVSLTGEFYSGQEGRAKRIDPWKTNLKDLREFTERLYMLARKRDILGDLVVEIP